MAEPGRNIVSPNGRRGAWLGRGERDYPYALQFAVGALQAIVVQIRPSLIRATIARLMGPAGRGGSIPPRVTAPTKPASRGDRLRSAGEPAPQGFSVAIFSSAIWIAIQALIQPSSMTRDRFRHHGWNQSSSPPVCGRLTIRAMAVILIVEDGAQVRVLSESYLQEQGHQTLSAATPGEALAVLDHGHDRHPVHRHRPARRSAGQKAAERHPDLGVLYTSCHAFTDGMKA
jgi:hypothetical protein